MSTIQHNTLTTTDLHENKGVSTASNNTVATASSGATVWKLLDNTNVGALANPFANFAQFREQQASGVASSTSLSSSFGTIALNTTTVSQTWVTLSSNQLILNAGTYVILASLPVASTGTNATGKLKLRNITSSSDIFFGQNTQSGTGTLYGTFTVTGTPTVAIQAAGFSGGGSSIFVIGAGGHSTTEVYGEVILWKIA